MSDLKELNLLTKEMENIETQLLNIIKLLLSTIPYNIQQKL